MFDYARLHILKNIIKGFLFNIIQQKAKQKNQT